MRIRLSFLAATAVLPMIGCADGPEGQTEQARAADQVDIQILSISDWHGQLDPVNGVGGAAVISSYWKADRAANPNTLTLTAGDAFGASPPLSNFFGDEPAVKALGLMGLQADTLGNHNFDRGLEHLQGLIDLADYPFVSSNLGHLDGNLEGVAPYVIVEIGGVKIGVVGATNPDAPTLVTPGALGDITVTDPVPAVNRAAAHARAEGAQVLVAICHMGVTGFNADGTAYGPLIDFADNVGGFDVVLGDHTDLRYSGIHNHALVVEANSKGASYGRTTLRVDPTNGRVVSKDVVFVTPVAAAVTPDAAILDMLAPYRAELGTVLRQVVGSSSVRVLRSDSCGNSAGRICESRIGNAVTDAMRETYGTDFAMTNSGGLRAALTCPTTDDPNDFCPPFVAPPYPITYGQVFTVLPFGNEAVTVTITGAELLAMLERGVSAMPAVDGRFGQVSGLCFTYDISAPVGARVTGAVRQASDGTCTGEALDLTAAATYTMAANDFMLAGGDGYPNVSDRFTTREMMDQVLGEWITAHGTISPSIQGRVVCTTSGATACPAITAP